MPFQLIGLDTSDAFSSRSFPIAIPDDVNRSCILKAVRRISANCEADVRSTFSGILGTLSRTGDTFALIASCTVGRKCYTPKRIPEKLD
jgi:hypothetical protein